MRHYSLNMAEPALHGAYKPVCRFLFPYRTPDQQNRGVDLREIVRIHHQSGNVQLTQRADLQIVQSAESQNQIGMIGQNGFYRCVHHRPHLGLSLHGRRIIVGGGYCNDSTLSAQIVNYLRVAWCQRNDPSRARCKNQPKARLIAKNTGVTQRGEKLRPHLVSRGVPATAAANYGEEEYPDDDTKLHFPLPLSLCPCA